MAFYRNNYYRGLIEKELKELNFVSCDKYNEFREV